MKRRNHRMMVQSSPATFHDKITVELEHRFVEHNLLLQTAPDPEWGNNYPINTRPFYLAKVKPR